MKPFAVFVNEKQDYSRLLLTQIRKARGTPHSGFAIMTNSSTPPRIALAMGESLPNAVINAIKNTTIQTAMNIATAHIPRFQFLLMSSMSFRIFLSIYSVPVVVF